MNHEITGSELASWRASKKHSLRDVAQMLGVSSSSTINAWEHGQEIPGPAQKLLAWLIRGEVPFQAAAEESALKKSLKEQAWKVEMSLSMFDRLRTQALADGYDDVADYMAELVRRYLVATEPGTEVSRSAPEAEIGMLADQRSEQVVPERRAVVYPKVPRKPRRL